VLRPEAGGPPAPIVRAIYELEVLVAQCAPREQVLEQARRIVPEYQKDHSG